MFVYALYVTVKDNAAFNKSQIKKIPGKKTKESKCIIDVMFTNELAFVFFLNERLNEA